MSQLSNLRNQDGSRNAHSNEDEWERFAEVNDPDSGKRVDNQIHA